MAIVHKISSRDEVYVMRFVNDFFRYFYLTNNTNCHNITEILLKVALNTPAASYRQTLSHKVVLSTPHHEQDSHNIGCDRY
jgi:hypothetical protein